MLIDIGEVRKYIKPKADSTLQNMRKGDLIEYIRCLENNYNVAVSFNENQARYIESLDITKVVWCKDCKEWERYENATVSGKCRYLRRMRMDDDFCSYGERKDDER